MISGASDRFEGKCFSCVWFRQQAPTLWFGTCEHEDRQYPKRSPSVHPESRCVLHEEAHGRHAAVCAECGEVWPCAHVRWMRDMAYLSRTLQETCPVCGKRAGSGSVGVVQVGEEHFHVRKKRCLAAALALVSREDAERLLARVEARWVPGRFDRVNARP